MMSFVCPECKMVLNQSQETYACPLNHFYLRSKNGILITSDVDQAPDKKFYDTLYETEHGEQWFQGLNRTSFAKRILEKISLSYRRERFFKRNIQGPALILDIACGAGRDYFKKFGTVVGIDLSYKPLEIAKDRYDFVIQGGVDRLPFEDGTFDYIVSSDFFGHVRHEDKDQIMREIYRSLKPGGKTLHVIETDSGNRWFQYGHRYPDLFQKYFIEKIGGHVGLEMPDKCVERWEKHGFIPEKVEKIWGTVWPIRDYASFFDNEYKEKIPALRPVVWASKIGGKVKLIEVGINCVLNSLNSLVERLTPLNHGQGLMIVCQKK